MPEGSPDRRRTFVPVVGAGVAAATLAAVAGSRPWVRGFDAAPGGAPLPPTTAEAGESPLAATLSLVVLACWGVLLVTRGVVRRVVAVLVAVSSLGLLAATVSGFSSLQDAVLESMRESGATSDTLGIELTAWYWVAAASAVVLLAAALLACAWCPTWPEMGGRYDAPGSSAGASDDVPPEERSNLDLWRQLDEGRDPTA